jgi:MoaA/NifB/PqqE/SkfB family radical SAM enzyme
LSFTQIYGLYKWYSNLKKSKIETPIFGSFDITNRCNLGCAHCYWWKNKCKSELGAKEWTKIAREMRTTGILGIALCGGEPLLRLDVVKELTKEVNCAVITNGTIPFPESLKNVGFSVSVDGTEKIHNKIRGAKTAGFNVYQSVRENVIASPSDVILINMTLNRLNMNEIEGVVKEFYDYAKGMSISFCTPFSHSDPLWIPYGSLRDKLIDKIRKIKRRYPHFIVNTEKQLEVFRSSEWTENCPSFAFLSFDSMGRIKKPCILGKGAICDKCGLDCMSGAYTIIDLNDSGWTSILYNNFKKRNLVRGEAKMVLDTRSLIKIGLFSSLAKIFGKIIK